MLTQQLHQAPAARPTLRHITLQTSGLSLSVTLHPLGSSLLESAGYDGAQTLILVFRALPGAAPIVHAYSGVPVTMFQQLLDAPSPGKFYALFIWNRYSSEPATLSENTSRP